MTSFRLLSFLMLFCLSIGSFTATTSHAEEASADQLEYFEKKVRPLLVKHCYECHSASAKRIEGSLLLDRREGHLKGGDSGAAIVPGDADGSLLIESIRYESYEMPPKGKLSEEDIDVFVRWIDMGAPWPEEPAPTDAEGADKFDLDNRRDEFWVWQPFANAQPPEVRNANWIRTPIDSFILAQLEEAGLKPTHDADRTAILRRVYFDLIGIPPSAEQVRAFIADDQPGAIDRVVDELLASPHFGERWARHWLDLVRYAESRGHEFDNDTPNAFQYRDYVIRALNADVPYDQFVTEHIAGDLLKQPRLHPTEGFNESVLGTGFWFLGEWVHSPVDIRKDESDRFDNMIDVMSKTFLGVTVACARCHDHKFDAISTADYYSLSGFLQSSDYRQVRFESMEQNQRIAEQLARVDEKYQRQIVELLENHSVRLPAQTSYMQSDAIVFNYATMPQSEYRQDGVVFGSSPRQAGRVYLSSDSGNLDIAKFGSATNDLIWEPLQSITEGQIQDRNRISQIPKSGRTLRTPTFELKKGQVECLVKGAGTVVAVVDSHRLVNGPLHGQTVKAFKHEDDNWAILNLERYIGHRIHLEITPDTNAQLSLRLVTQGLGQDERTRFLTELAAHDEQFVEYAKSAEELLNANQQTEVVEERVFEDFESGTYEGWTITGDAFGDIPQTLKTIGSYQGKINGRGQYFVNSHNIRLGGDVRKGDSLTGTMTSQEFLIDFDSIEFLVGGGNHKGRTCVNLIVEGKPVLSATGRANNQMSLTIWDVRPFTGKKAKIEVVDNHTTGWGNIGIDHIVFQKTKPVASHQETRLNVGQSSPARAIIRAWQADREQLAKQIVRESRLAPAMLDGTGEDDHILIRGNSSKPGEIEPRHFLTAIAGNSPMHIKTGSGRLELAEHINDPTNPLTSRVIVNRIWHHLMGRGIVPTTDDFGFLGQRASHPELLDHLASHFLSDGRSIKRLIKYIVLSRTYQMSSHVSAGAIEADPKNLLWHHRPPKRLQGEAIRDSLLAISERLNPTLYGPPVPIHLTAFMDGRGRPGQSGPLDGNGRRSIYIAVRRNFLSPFMLTFDTPVPFSSMGRRNVSNVPAQALILLNDPLVVELSKKWGALALQNVEGAQGEATIKRVEWMYLSAFARFPTEQERKTAKAFLSSQAKERGVAIDHPDLWASFAHALVNTKEFIFLR